MRGDFFPSRLDGNGKRTANSANSAVEREFTHEKAVGNFLLIQAAVGSQNPQGHGQVEARSFLSYVGWRQVDGDVRGWNIEAAVLERGANAITALTDCGIR